VAVLPSPTGPRALDRRRAGQASRPSAVALRTALGLAGAAGNITLVRAAIAALLPDRIATDPILQAFRDASSLNNTRKTTRTTPEV